ncbi:MAG TPA: hypothetical protein DEE98_01690 [Elusimicrobia bacterium]|nr:MAG: hypothetical protein A2278_06025 [Elusimicrobia bacterium RIFOXYA12_FULL_49_49]OGS10865.1 MAG: hypothetical protein A2386_06075 [Elusimicrobia bacterium RIFOXYB1_FULL_48_9]OGS16651.1 MAG: hypothetical protein A2251_04710 [Elusimicrobia bacterium RIFOXYA2_FULL_47_53]OGS25500.1 MAG: hypothetical protein A2339_00285 [Elusimicrobia bacterium RIFOXYB12_FULL_50_12]OGS31629.1 MAG: hypothetical protein A2323_03430 [Elusimicrobia bacterium RIFOXYB2_FULL_46_23]HBU69076.1 hypothetical protein [El
MRNVFLITAALVLIVSGAAHSSYCLSLGFFSSSEAQDLHRQLVSRGYPAYMLYGDACEIRLGNYETLEQASLAAEKLKSEEKVVGRVIEEEEFDQSQFAWQEEADGAGKEVFAETAGEYSDPRAQKIVSLGLNLFGHPYKYGGTRIGKGIDCSFFVQTIFRELGIALPRTSGEQFKAGRQVEKTDLKVGDLLFFKKTYYSRKNKSKGVTRINHVGIYIGNGEFIHATKNVMSVTISKLSEPYFVKRYAGSRRVLSDLAKE